MTAAGSGRSRRGGVRAAGGGPATGACENLTVLSDSLVVTLRDDDFHATID